MKVLHSLTKIPKMHFGGDPIVDPKTIHESRTLIQKIKTKTMYYRDPEEISDIVTGIIANHHNLKTKEIALSNTFQQLGLNVLDKQEILFQMEEFFDITINYDIGEKINSVHDMVQYLSKNIYVQ